MNCHLDKDLRHTRGQAFSPCEIFRYYRARFEDVKPLAVHPIHEALQFLEIKILATKLLLYLLFIMSIINHKLIIDNRYNRRKLAFWSEFTSAFAAQVHSICASVTAVCLSFFVFGRVLTRLD